MNPNIVGLIGLVVFFLLMLLRMPIGVAFLVPGFFGLWYLTKFGAAVDILGTVPYRAMTEYIWTTIPLFVFMGFLAQRTKLAEEFFEGTHRLIGQMRGGLAQTVVIANAAFGACTGDPMSAAVTFVKVSLPELRKYNYSDRLTMGSIAGGAHLSGLIPPSLPFIIFGAITETSIGALFIGGILPGLLLAALYMILIYILCLRNPELGPPGPKTTFREKMVGIRGMSSMVVIFVVIIGGFYLGLFSPTEVAAGGAFVVFVMGLARRRLNWPLLKEAVIEAGATTCLIGLIVCGVYVFSRFMTISGMAAVIAKTMVGISGGSPVAFLLILVGVFIILGCFMDVLSITILTIPILYPASLALGINPVHFGVVLAIVGAMGTVTPPFGVVVFAMYGATREYNIPLYTIFWGVIPFCFAMLACCLLVLFFPQIATFLPSLMWNR